MEVLYSDRWLVVINKPAGLLTIQDGYDLNAPHVRTLIESEFGHCWIVHRLDKDTSGVLLLARTKEAHRSLSILFEKRKIIKDYRAVVEGKPHDEEFEINLPLRVDGDRRHRTIVNIECGRPALTFIHVISSNGDLTLLSAQPKTGYTHQIRAHLSYIGFPLLGDQLYNPAVTNAKPENNSLIGRMALHALSITFLHPFTGKEFAITAPYPSDFSRLIETLK